MLNSIWFYLYVFFMSNQLYFVPITPASVVQRNKQAAHDRKESMTYARSLGAFMSPDDAMFLKNAVQVDRKVVVECVVTTEKGKQNNFLCFLARSCITVFVLTC